MVEVPYKLTLFRLWTVQYVQKYAPAYDEPSSGQRKATDESREATLHVKRGLGFQGPHLLGI